MNAPTPRPALKKAADAHIHPAAPGHTAHSLRVAADSAADAGAGDPARAIEPATAGTRDAAATPGVPRPRVDADSAAPAPHRLSGPLRGTTSDGLRAAAKRSRRAGRGPAEKQVELTVKVPKSLRKEFRNAVKSGKQDPDDVVAALLRAWLSG